MLPFSIEPFREKIRRAQHPVPASFIVVDSTLQQLYCIEGSTLRRSFTISTSQFGMGNREGSNQTPRGIHRVIEKIGEGVPSGRIFKDRIDTGCDWHPDQTGDNMILTRIIRLEGLEEGVNCGPGIDSFDRYIYIHGTNREHLIGSPLSHGCVCMKNSDIIELFDLITEGTLVIID